MNPETFEKCISIIQSYLTRKEAKVIIPQIRENYNPNFSSEWFNYMKGEQLLPPNTILAHLFDWAETLQGSIYWREIYLKIMNRYDESEKSE